ncbi:MAG: transposase, partial [Gammaproteobacteria bacterium]
DGVYRSGAPLRFQALCAPTVEELQHLVEQIAEQIGRALERQGLLVRDAEQAYLATESESSAVNAGETADIADLIAHSVTYRIATGPRAGQKVFTVQSLPPLPDAPAHTRLAQAGGFSLHAGIAIGGDESEKLERLCRYISRPSLAPARLALTAGGAVRYSLKTPYRDGTTHVLFEPLDFLARLAALVPPPRVHLTRFHGLFAPHNRLHALVTPAGRGPRASHRAPKYHAMGWMQRLKRAFRIDIQTCVRCGGRLRIIASIEAPALIRHILDHLERRDGTGAPPPPARAPPAAWLSR